jgi:hypothetical protein
LKSSIQEKQGKAESDVSKNKKGFLSLLVVFGNAEVGIFSCTFPPHPPFPEEIYQIQT